MGIVSLFVTVSIFLNFATSKASDKYEARASFGRFECSNDRSILCRPNVCNYKLVQPGVAAFSIACHLEQPVQQAWISVKSLTRGTNNVYKPPSFLHFEDDLCAMLDANRICDDGSTTFWIDKIVPRFSQSLHATKTACPLAGTVTINQYLLDSKVLATVLPSGDYQIALVVRTETGERIFEGHLSIVVRNKDLF